MNRSLALDNKKLSIERISKMHNTSGAKLSKQLPDKNRKCIQVSWTVNCIITKK